MHGKVRYWHGSEIKNAKLISKQFIVDMKAVTIIIVRNRLFSCALCKRKLTKNQYYTEVKQLNNVRITKFIYVQKIIIKNE
jgi:hypothetical protein